MIDSTGLYSQKEKETHTLRGGTADIFHAVLQHSFISGQMYGKFCELQGEYTVSCVLYVRFLIR